MSFYMLYSMDQFHIHIAKNVDNYKEVLSINHIFDLINIPNVIIRQPNPHILFGLYKTDKSDKKYTYQSNGKLKILHSDDEYINDLIKNNEIIINDENTLSKITSPYFIAHITDIVEIYNTDDIFIMESDRDIIISTKCNEDNFEKTVKLKHGYHKFI
jgi:hypothetical protein